MIFEVGGVIRLRSRIDIYEPFLTIAGQTAPSPGITLYGDSFKFSTHDVLVQHLRIRAGDDITGTNTPLELRDGIGVRNNPSGSEKTYNIVIDHCSMSWAVDENVSLWYPNIYDITVRSSIIAEGLRSELTDKPLSRGMIVGRGSRRVSVLRNLFAHNGFRNPLFTSDSTGMIVNNLIYNIWLEAITMGSRGDGPIWLTAVGNVYLPGPGSNPTRRTVMVHNKDPKTRLFVDDNIGPYFNGDPWSAVDNRVGEYIRADEPPVRVAPLTVLDSARTFGHVLRNAGARPRDRDAVDRRIVNDVRRGGGKLIGSPDEVGGLPASRATRRGLRPPVNSRTDLDGDGYTDVEEWLHCMARKVEGWSSSLRDTCLGPAQGVAHLGDGER